METKSKCIYSGKVSFPKKREASIRFNYIQKRGMRGKSRPIRIYQCGQCHQWHLTSK